LRDVSLSESERERSLKALQGRLSAALLLSLTGLESSRASAPGLGLDGFAGKRSRRLLLESQAESPADPRWQLELAYLDVQEGKLKQAASRLDSMVETMPESTEVRCLRLAVSTARNQCAGILEDSPFCDSIPLDLSAARNRLRCLVRYEEWGLARQVVDGLEPGLRAQPRLQRLIGRVTEESDGRPPAVESIEEVEVAGPEETETAPGLSAMAEVTLQRAEEALLTATNVAELELHLESVESLLQLHPDGSEARVLAARIAYRASLWKKTVDYLRGSQAAVEASPSLQFSLAVALYESGHRQEAATALVRALPFLEPTSFVLAYKRKILDAIKAEGD